MKRANALTLIVAISLLALGGCVRTYVEADARRKSALEPVVAEYVAKDPTARTERWSDFMRAWQIDIDANRKGVLPWWLGGGQNVETPAPVTGGEP